jgi:hypothetical protein
MVGVEDELDELMVDIVSIEVDMGDEVLGVVDVFASELLCSVVVDIGVFEVVVLCLVDSVVVVGAESSTPVVCVSAFGPVRGSAVSGSACVSAPSGPRRNGVPALGRRPLGTISEVIPRLIFGSGMLFVGIDVSVHHWAAIRWRRVG